MTSTFVPRPHQVESERAVELALANGSQSIFANIFPGSGKTNNGLLAIQEYLAAGEADCAVWLTPRTNLCTQVEESSSKLHKLRGGDYQVVLSHRDNAAPLFREKIVDGRIMAENAYATTYQSLIARPSLHFDALRGRRYVLILDEAQTLGVGDDRVPGTRSTDEVKRLAENAVLYYPMSGTVTRSDGKAVFGGVYGDPNEDGVRPLLADVNGTYKQGVQHGYLRPFDFEMVDGNGEWETASGVTETLHLATMTSGMSKVTSNEGYWQPLVDATVESVHDAQKIHPRFRGLIAANRQDQAKDILRYLQLRYPGVRPILAVSDERLAIDNLRQFKPDRAPYDVLVTVQMAYIGYDCPWISTVCVLNDIRWPGFLDQLLARGMRVTPDVPFEQQTIRAILPADPAIQAYAERLRGNAQDGLRDRQERTGPGPDGERRQPELGWTTMAEATDRMVRGFGGPSGDVEPSEFEFIETVRKQYRMTGPRSEIARFLRDHGISFGGRQAAAAVREPETDSPSLTQREREKLARVAVNKRFRSFDRQLMDIGYPNAKYGTTATEWMFHNNGRRMSESTMADIAAANTWLDTVWAPFVAEKVGGRG